MIRLSSQRSPSFIGLFLLSLGFSYAGDISPFDLGCELHHWTIDDGLPATSVQRLAQTPDGYLWVGTQSGLSRFNGTDFETILIEKGPANDPTIRVADLYVDSSGRLWVLDQRGRLLLRDSQGFHTYAEDLGIPRSVAGVVTEAEGKITLITQADGCLSVHQWDGQRAICTWELKKPYLGYPFSSVTTEDGRIWGTLFFDGLFTVTNGEMEMMTLNAGLGESHSLFIGLDDQPYLLTSNGICRYEAGQWKMDRPFKTPLDTGKNINQAAVDLEGHLWIGSQRAGLSIANTSNPPQVDQLHFINSNRDLRTVLRAHDGSIFAGGHGGLFRFRRNPILPWPASQELLHSDVLSITQDRKGAMWFAGYDGILSLPSRGRIELKPDPDPDSKMNIIARGHSNEVWVTAFSGKFWRGSTKRWEEQPHLQVDNIPSNRTIYSAIEVSPGDLWISRNGNLLRFQNGILESINPTGEGSHALVSMIAEGANGAVIAGMVDGRLLRWKSGTWETLIDFDQNSRSKILNLTQAPDGSIWYRRNNNNLGRWRDGHWGELPAEALNFPDTFNLAADSHGGLWLGFEDHGVLWLDAEAAEKHITGESDEPIPHQYLDASNGLISRSVSERNSGIFRANDGKIWVAGPRGATSIDPAPWKAHREIASPPQVHIESVRASGMIRWKSEYPDGNTAIIPAEDNRFEIRFGVIHPLPQDLVKIRCRLTGYEDTYRDVSDELSVAYNAIPPGNYTFQIETNLSNGDANSQSDQLAIVIIPYWWERKSFRALAYAGISGFILLIIGSKIRALRREGKRKDMVARGILEAEESERKRVASELHDGIGHSILGIRNLAMLSDKKHGENAENRHEILEIAQSATKALDEVRAISRALRPPELDLLGLTKAIWAMGDRVSDNSEFTVEMELDDIDHCLSKEKEISVFRLLQEALNNAVKYSEAKHIRLCISKTDSHISASLIDDGCGFDPSTTESGLGLETMQERASLMNACLEIESSPGNGTQIALSIPRS